MCATLCATCTYRYNHPISRMKRRVASCISITIVVSSFFVISYFLSVPGKPREVTVWGRDRGIASKPPGARTQCCSPCNEMDKSGTTPGHEHCNFPLSHAYFSFSFFMNFSFKLQPQNQLCPSLPFPCSTCDLMQEVSTIKVNTLASFTGIAVTPFLVHITHMRIYLYYHFPTTCHFLLAVPTTLYSDLEGGYEKELQNGNYFYLFL